MTDREVRVRLSVAGTQQFQQSMQQAAQSTQQLGQSVQQGTQQTTAGMQETSSNASKMAKTVGAAFAGLAVADFLKDSISAASDLNETVNKASTIFGDQAAAMEAWASTATTSVGLSKAAALDAAAGFGDMFSQLGFAGSAAASMSKDVVQMAADLGSFNNLGTDEVLDKISGAMRGEYDSLQSLIPNINAARVEQEALAESGKKATSELTAQDKAAATLAIIHKDGARAAGDFAKTSDGLANSQKILAAEVENAKADIGTGLLPIMQTLVKLVRDVGVPVLGLLGDAFGVIGTVLGPVLDALGIAVSAFGSLPGPVKAGVLALAAFVTLQLTGTFRAIGAAVAGLPAKFGAMAASARTAGLTMKTALIGSGVGLVIAGIATALQIFSSRNAEAEARVEAHKEAVDRLAGSLDTATGSITDATNALIIEDFGNVRDEFTSIGLSAGDAAKAIIAGAKDGGTSWEEYRGRIADAAIATGRLNDISVEASGIVDAVASKTGKSGEEIARAFLAGGSAAAQFVPVLKELYQTDDAGAADKINNVRGEFEKTVPAIRSFRLEQDSVSDTLKTGADKAAVAAEANAAVAASTQVAAKASAELDGALRSGAQSQQDAYLAHLNLAGAQGDQALAAQQAAKADADAAAAASEAEAATTPYALAVQTLASAQNDLRDSVQEVLTQLDKMAGRMPSVEQANSDLAQASADMADKFKLGTKEAEKLGSAVLNSDGSVNTATQGARDFRDSLLKQRDATTTAAQAAYDKAVADGDLAGAQGKAKDAAQVGYDAFIKNATAILGSKTAAEKAAKAYGLIPSQVATTIKVVDQGSPVADAFVEKLKRINGTTVYTNIVTNEQRIVTASGAIGRWMGGPVPGFADGGSPSGILGIPGPADPRQDNLWGAVKGKLFKFRGDEFITNPKASRVFRAQLEAMNAAVPAFAGGGVPSGSNLAGIADPSYSGRESVTRSALADLVGWIRDLNDAAKDAAKTRNEEAASYYNVRVQQNQNVAAAKADRAEKLAEAAANIKAAKTFDERARALKEHDKVNRETFATLAKVTAERNKEVSAAKREYEAQVRAQNAATARAAEANRDAARTAQARSLLVSLARQTDQVTAQFSAASDRLKDLQADWSSMRGSLRNTIAGFDNGILGHSDQRRTAADIIRGLQFNNEKVSGFSADLSKARSLGLSADLLQQIAGAGVDGGAVTAHALANATKAQIAEINKMTKVVANSADRGAMAVANATYSKVISDQTAVNRDLSAKLGRLETVIGGLGKDIAGQFTALSPQGLNAIIVKAQRELARR